ncbi:MAG: sensor histidine kinase [Chloroflexi bacterium]|nr:sensor histidine kinase [Chloroflexota bacterium]
MSSRPVALASQPYGGTTDDFRLIRFAGLALAAAVWILGIFAPRAGGLTPAYVASFTALLVMLVAVEQLASRERPGSRWGLLWLAGELALSFAIVQVHGTLVRPALIYLLPASRALLTFGERPGLSLSLSVWLAYSLNVGLYAYPDKWHEYPNYLSFFLAPYVLGVVPTLAVLRQVRDRRQVQALYDELRQAHEELRALHEQAREAAVTEERNRLAREIHDSLAHYLTVVNVQLEAAEKLGATQPERAIEHASRARRLTVECLQEVRRSVGALRSATLAELTLAGALRKLTTEFAESSGLTVELDLGPAEATRLASEVTLALYRVTQEGLTNAYRHAQATSVRVSFCQDNGTVELAVEDDGVGPRGDSASATDGFGLLGLQERVALLGGHLTFGAGAARGSRLVVSLPAAPV